MQYELQKFIITALLGFALGIAGNVITFFLLNRDRYIRILDRETKRLAFWKAMRELKTDSSEETGLSQAQINALNQRFREDVQKSVDVTMGWEKDAYVLASAAAWLATTLLVCIAADGLLPFLNLAQRSGMTPGTPEYFVTELASMLGFCFALRALIYRPTYEAERRKTVRLMRDIRVNSTFLCFFTNEAERGETHPLCPGFRAASIKHDRCGYFPLG